MTTLATRFGNSLSLKAPAGDWLTEDEMRARLPAIFAEDAHASRSSRYTFIPTTEVLRGLAKEGFHPTFACQAKTRDPEMFGHTKHMLRFRRDFSVGLHSTFPEVVMVNSHGGQSKYQLFGGMFELVCLNGMVVSRGGESEDIRVPHKGNIVDNVIEGTFRVLDDLAPVTGRVSEMKALTLSSGEQLAMAEAAATLRFNLEAGERSPVAPEQFLRRRRYEDDTPSLWHTFNRVQENTIRGGLHGVTTDANNRRRNMSTREVNGIDQNVALNRALWVLAERMRELKTA